MSMILITGTPGSGKTLFAVSKIIKWLGEGRKVYADIDGLNIEGVEPSPEDWRTTPQGSIVVYDEAQQRDLFKKTRSTLSDNQIVKDFEVHRHTGHDIVFITQSPIFLHTHIRELIGEHFHLHRPYGAKLASVYFWRLCQNNPNTKTAKSVVESTSLFNYDKKLFNYYKSATVHTHKLRIPTKLILIALGILISSIAIYYYAHKSKILNPAAKIDQSVETNSIKSDSKVMKPIDLPQPKILDDQMTKNMIKHQNEIYSHNLEVINYNPLLRVAGVIIHDNDCKAFNEYGERLYLPENDCFTASEYMTHGRSSGNDLRSNAHQGNQQQDTVNLDQPTPTQPT